MTTTKYDKARENYQAALITAEANRDEQAQALAHIGLAGVAHALDKAEQASAYLKSVTASEYLDAVTILLNHIEGVDRTSKSHPIDLVRYAHLLAERVAPYLVDELRLLPDSFLAQLDNLEKQSKLRTVWAMGADQDADFEAMELLAATYLTTRTLIETLSPAEIKTQAQTGQLLETLRHQAEKIARETIGLSTQQAQVFAEQYAVLVGGNLEALWTLFGPN